MKYSELPKKTKNDISGLHTPYFLFDLDIIKNNVKTLKNSLDLENIFYAVKCNSLPMVLQTLHEAGCGFEVNNMAEFNKAIATGISPEKIINSSPITPRSRSLFHVCGRRSALCF